MRSCLETYSIWAQVIDLARMFVYNPTTLSQLEGGLHHIAPLVRVVNALVIPVGAPPISARNLLFLMWLVQEVCTPFSLTPFCLLRSDRKGLLRPDRLNSGDSSELPCHQEMNFDPRVQIHRSLLLEYRVNGAEQTAINMLAVKKYPHSYNML